MDKIKRHPNPTWMHKNYTKERALKISLSRMGKYMDENNPVWKGNKVGYRALHNWVEQRLGKPSVCKNCGKDNLFKQKIGWANISHKYKRDLNDWIRLCRLCHKRYDMGRMVLSY